MPEEDQQPGRPAGPGVPPGDGADGTPDAGTAATSDATPGAAGRRPLGTGRSPAAERVGRPNPQRAGRPNPRRAGRDRRAAGGTPAQGGAVERQERRANRRRGPVLLGAMALLVAGGIADHEASWQPAATTGAVPPVPVASAVSALSSTWLCGGALGHPAGVADGTLEIANTTGRALTGDITLVPSSGRRTRIPVSLAPRSRQAFAETAAAEAAYVGAVVDLNGGGASVEQVISGGDGVSVTPCATSGSSHWYFATGTTLRDAHLYFELLNPYPQDAIVDLSFTTEQGIEAPADFQGIVVPPRAEVGIDVGSHLRRRYEIAATVSARTGRVVAFKTQVIGTPPKGAVVVGNTPPAPADPADPVPPVAGLTLTLGAPSPALEWTWPDGVASVGQTERYQLYNPTSSTAHVQLAFALDQGVADPLAVTLEPHGTETVIANLENRIPQGIGHAATLRSTNGVPVVAERTLTASAPSRRSGLGELFGGRLAAKDWILAAGDASPTTDEQVVIYNPSGAPTTASLVRVGGAGASVVTRVTVGAGRRVSLRVTAADQAHRTLMVQAAAGVVVERDLYVVGGRGVALSLGVPLLP